MLHDRTVTPIKASILMDWLEICLSSKYRDDPHHETLEDAHDIR